MLLEALDVETVILACLHSSSRSNTKIEVDHGTPLYGKYIKTYHGMSCIHMHHHVSMLVLQFLLRLIGACMTYEFNTAPQADMFRPEARRSSPCSSCKSSSWGTARRKATRSQGASKIRQLDDI